MTVTMPTPPGSLAEMDYLTIRYNFESLPRTITYREIAYRLGISVSRVRTAVSWGKNNDSSINIVMPSTSRKDHPIHGGPRNGIMFKPVPDHFVMEGLLFTLKRKQTIDTTVSNLVNTAQITEHDPMRQRLWLRDREMIRDQISSTGSVIDDIELMRST